MTTVRRAAEVLGAIAGSRRGEVWISRVPEGELMAAAAEIDRRVAAGEVLPLAGMVLAVKDNIDVAGVPTTAGCPAYACVPDAHAPAVAALLDAGALFVGKTNLDQFATGLVGTRSPYGAVRNAVSPRHISGGSSSGSGVAVALGLADIALGTDTAGSGRIPAALNGVVGVKPTRGLVSTRGVVPACHSFDCVSVFARDVATGERALAVMAGFDPADGRSRRVPPTAPLAAPPGGVIGYASGADLDALDPVRGARYSETLEDLQRAGWCLEPVDLAPFFAAGDLLYQGAFVAERYAAVGAWADAHPDEMDPVVWGILSASGRRAAHGFAADLDRLMELRQETAAALDGITSLVLPTAPFHPTIGEVSADPVGVNTRLGRYTTFANLLDHCVVSVPAGVVGGLPFGVSCIGPAWTDLVQADVARAVEGRGGAGAGVAAGGVAAGGGLAAGVFPSTRLLVVGAHLSGQPLNGQLTDRGARLAARTTTAACYRLYALKTDPPKPGLVRVTDGGAAIEGEVWDLPPAGFADFVAALPPPMGVGPVVLADGSSVTGFLCETVALEGAADITSYGGWRAFLAQGRGGPGRTRQAEQHG